MPPEIDLRLEHEVPSGQWTSWQSPSQARKRRAIQTTLEETEASCFSALTRAERTALLRLMRKVSGSLD